MRSPVRPKKRAPQPESLCSIGQRAGADELLVPAAAGPYATVQRRVAAVTGAGAHRVQTRTSTAVSRFAGGHEEGAAHPRPSAQLAMASANLADEPAPDRRPRGRAGGRPVGVRRSAGGQ